MPDRSRTKKPKRDANQLARDIVDRATKGRSSEADSAAKPKKNPAAVALGRRGGLKGGKARAEALSADERAEIARRAALSRWGRDS